MSKYITRHRIQQRWFRKPLLVLQIGTLANTGDGDDVVPSMRNTTFYRWKDAQLEDIHLPDLSVRNEP